jgi:predicted outer membrane protein
VSVPPATGFALQVVLVAFLVVAFPASAAADHHPPTPAEVEVKSASGPIGPADRDLLVKVRLAGLWEMPAGQMAVDKGTRPRVREIGEMIAAQHHALDELVLQAAATLRVELPSQANADQLGWLAEMERANGDEFDQVFVDRLRAAHGKIFPVIGEVRAGTRNDVVRDLAQQANAYVLNHISLLESTGLVDWNRLPLPPEPVQPALVGQGLVKSGVDPFVIWLMLAVAVVAGASTMLRVVRLR